MLPDSDDTIAVQASRLKEQAAKITELQHRLLEITAKEDSLKSQVELAKQHAQQVRVKFFRIDSKFVTLLYVEQY